MAHFLYFCAQITNIMTQLISASGSNRQYSRITDEKGQTYIHVVGTNKDENHAFITLARHFAAKGLNVPHVLNVSDNELEYDQTDLGDTILFDLIRNGRETGVFSAEEKQLLVKTIRALAHIQVEGAQGIDWSVCFPVPAMDSRAVMWDLNYFKYCFLKGTKIEFSEPKLENEFERLTDRLVGSRAPMCGTPTFLYRDFQSRNVMVQAGEPYFIDFQGGRRGPVYYDLASFLWQAKANYPQALREELITAYVDELGKISDIRFDRGQLDYFVLFRTLQVLGAYGYRGYFERKPHFLESIPAAIQNLQSVLDGDLGQDFPYLHELAKKLISPVACRLSPVACRLSPVACNLLTVSIYSFSFKKGLPEDESGNGGGYVFDCRSTHNPGKYPEFQHLTGRDKEVIDWLEKDGEILTFLESVYKIVDHHVERFIERGFTHLQVAFGCTGGQHRSVYSAEALAKHIRECYPQVHVEINHREQ